MLRVFDHCASGYHKVDLTDLVTVSKKEAIDFVYDVESDVDTLIMQLTLAAARGKDVRDYYSKDRLKGISTNLKKMVEVLTKDDCDEYYFLRSTYQASYDNVRNRAEDTLRSCYKKIPTDLITYEVELKDGPKVVEKHHNSNVLVTYLDFGEKNFSAYINSEAKARMKCEEIASTCRIFKCKSCGKMAYVSLEDDKHMKSLDLSPRQRCYKCSQKKRGKTPVVWHS